jgi:hypothetical protein
VNERLPADESFKMIWIRGESRPKNAWFGHGIKEWFDEDDNTWANTSPDNRFATVTHWRELPPPPLSQPSPVEAIVCKKHSFKGCPKCFPTEAQEKK